MVVMLAVYHLLTGNGEVYLGETKPGRNLGVYTVRAYDADLDVCLLRHDDRLREGCCLPVREVYTQIGAFLPVTVPSRKVVSDQGD
ncbi:hypothetical protein LCGC14_1337250 [marine sediment metagenome]|uniref:Uncharacterized protein n=1 Tax=marine sediment metagenome TaxID=412755 RepID=A0A0F9NH16_9ZZZZ